MRQEFSTRPRPGKLVMLALSALCCFSMALSQPTFAGEGSSGDDHSDEKGKSSLNRQTTRDVIRILQSGSSRCENEKKIYKWDCYRLVYREARRRVKENSSYDEAEKAFKLVEDRIDAVVTKNVDPAQPNRRRLVQTYRPVKPAAIPQVKREAVKAMEQAETILLRAPEHKARHYGRIAEAVNSNKVLLRSALLLLPAPLRAAFRVTGLASETPLPGFIQPQPADTDQS